MGLLNDPKSEERIRRELESLAGEWQDRSAEARAAVVRTECRASTAYSVLPLYFEYLGGAPGKIIDESALKGKGFSVRYGFDREGRVRTAVHYENGRVTIRNTAFYTDACHVWLTQRGRKIYVDAVRLDGGRPVEWQEGGDGALKVSRGVYDGLGRLVEVVSEQLSRGKTSEVNDRIAYDDNGAVASITRTGFGMEWVVYKAKPSRKKKASPAKVKGDAYVGDRSDELAAVALAYNEETSTPDPPFIGVIWKNELESSGVTAAALAELLNPADYETFDIPELSLDKAGIEAWVPGGDVAAQRSFYLEVVRHLKAEWNKGKRAKGRKIIFYATDLECAHLEKNLKALRISPARLRT